MVKLTQKQENFAKKYVECGNASEAYRFAYNAKNMKYETVNVKACVLLKQDNVAERVKKLQDNAQKRHNVTVDSLVAELQEARELAKDLQQPSTMVAASMGKGKIAGLDKTILAGDADNPIKLDVKVTFVAPNNKFQE